MCVLVVEDESLILMAAAGCLEDAGHEVMTAGHGLEAITLIEQWPVSFSVLVTDCHMPHGVTGGQLVQHMLIATARADVVTAEFHERHRVEVLIKQYNLGSLVATVGRLLGRALTG